MNVDFLSELNEVQREAVLFNDGASLVIAGAGSGKTRVLTYKIAYLLEAGFQPWQLLALTFTNKAAREMKERIARLVDTSQASRLWMGTFHSIFLRILRTDAQRLGFTGELTIYDSADSKSLIRAILKEKQLDEKLYKPGYVQGRISMAKNALITPSMYVADREITEDDHRAKMPALGDVYRAYMQRCKDAGAMDFDDILLYTNILFRDHPDVLAKYRDRFQYILVDEYQDTNAAQHVLVKQLVGAHGRVFVVGDDAQSIYSFRGANIDNILTFKNSFAGCRLFKLEQNYRSTQTIVNAANSLIKKNRGQIPKEVFSENGEGEKIRVFGAFTDIEEGYLVANKIAEMHMARHYGYNDFAILYRTNAQSRILEESLRKRGIPYRIYGGLSFYQRKEVKDVVAYLRVVVNPHDEEALKRIINYPARGIGETTVTKIRLCASTHQVSLWTVLCNPIAFNLEVNAGTAKKLNAFKSVMETVQAKNREGDVLEVTELLLKTSGILADLFADTSAEGLSKQQNVQEFLNAVNDYCSMKREEGDEAITTADFLSEISLATDQDKDDDSTENERVTMMTVHAAKGLEFKNVFVVGLEDDLFPSAMTRNSEREQEEERRLFYVALTRAEENCTLTFAKSRFRNGQTTMSNPSCFLSDIDPKYLIMAGGLMQMAESAEQRSPFFKGWKTERNDHFGGSSYAARRETTRPVSAVAPSVGNPGRKLTSIENLPAGSSLGLPSVEVGQRIRHERFGVGEVIRLEDSGDNAKMVVRFEQSGEKKLLLKFVKFTVVE